jgi:hypothetical protein
MALLNQPTQVYAQVPKFLETLRAGTAPPTFNRQFIKDIGFKSSNHHAFIPLLKGLNFLSDNGTPTERYKQFLDASRWRVVLAEAVLEAYSDIFVLKGKPTDSDLAMIQGKFKSTYNLSETQADRCARTFLALLKLCDPKTISQDKTPDPATNDGDDDNGSDLGADSSGNNEVLGNGKIDSRDLSKPIGLHYNIQIHLPATKDVETYNAIFKSIKEHLID